MKFNRIIKLVLIFQICLFSNLLFGQIDNIESVRKEYYASLEEKKQEIILNFEIAEKEHDVWQYYRLTGLINNFPSGFNEPFKEEKINVKELKNDFVSRLICFLFSQGLNTTFDYLKPENMLINISVVTWDKEWLEQYRKEVELSNADKRKNIILKQCYERVINDLNMMRRNEKLDLDKYIDTKILRRYGVYYLMDETAIDNMIAEFKESLLKE